MARFNPETYDPTTDSSPGATKPGTLVLNYADEFVCRCGCGEKPKNAKRHFVQGHDARLKGALIRAAVTDTPVEVREGKNRTSITAIAAAKVFGFGSQVTSAKARHAEAAKAANAKAAARAKDQAAKRKAVDDAKKAKKAKATKKAPAKKATKRTTKKAAAAPAPVEEAAEA